MSELEKTKYTAVNTLKHLCARCQEGKEHDCPVQRLIGEIQNLRGIPVMVNERLCHVVFS